MNQTARHIFPLMDRGIDKFAGVIKNALANNML